MQTLVTPYTNFSQILWGQYFPIPQKIVKKLIIYFCSKKIEIRFWTYIHRVARFYGEQDSQTLFSVSMISSRRHVLALTDIYRYDVLKSFRIFGARLELLFSFFFWQLLSIIWFSVKGKWKSRLSFLWARSSSTSTWKMR